MLLFQSPKTKYRKRKVAELFKKIDVYLGEDKEIYAAKSLQNLLDRIYNQNESFARFLLKEVKGHYKDNIHFQNLSLDEY